MRLELKDSGSDLNKTAATRVRGRAELDGWRQEIDEFYDIMNNFISDPDNIFRNLSAMSSRMSQVRTIVSRHEIKSYQHFRAQEIDPFLKECDRQFKIWSRVLSAAQMEWELTR